MRSVVSRLAHLEQRNRLSTAPQRLRIQYGYLKTLPDDYAGPRHTVTVKQLPPVEPGENWFQWEERPGLGPAKDDRLSDEQIIRVSYVERKGPVPATSSGSSAHTSSPGTL